MGENLNQQSLSHLAKVDMLRAFAILFVFFFHAQNKLFPHYFIDSFNTNHTLKIESVKDAVLNFSPISYGWSGVNLFLIISGFLIHLGYLKNKDKFNLKSFYSKRFWRIYPPYILVLLVVSVVKKSSYFYSTTGIFKHLLSHIFFVHNFADSTFFSLNGSFWSLALEVQLYIIYPLLLLLRKKYGMGNTFLFTLAFSLVFNLLGIAFDNFGTDKSYSFSILQLWFVWAAGAYLAEVHYNKQRIFNQKRVLAYVIILFSLETVSKYFSFTNYFQNYFVTFGWLAFFEWFLYTSKLSVSSLFSRVLIAIGLCSYSIYLIHEPIMGDLILSIKLIPPYVHNALLNNISLLIVPVIAFAVTFLISYSLYLFIEKKSIAYGQKRRGLGKF
jgi:peptidoglycan/LPS O-acetylase OafA/YrhL